MSKVQQKKENKNKIDKNKHPPNKETKNAKVIDIDKKEEEMLKGEIHKESPNPTENEIIQNKDSNLTNNNQNNNEKENNDEKKEEIKNEVIKKEVIIKPRMTYLKEKIKKNFSQSLISKVNKTLDNQIQNIKIDLKDNKVLIRNNTKNLKKLIPSEDRNINLTSDDNYKLKNKMRQIKELKDQEKILQNKLSILLSNEQFLNEKELYDSPKSKIFGKSDSPFKQRIKLIEMEKIQKQKEDLLFKISKVKNKIIDLININDEDTRKEKIKNFLDNFKRDKEIIEIRAKKYYKESKEIQKRMQNDIKSLIEKKQKEMEDQKEEIKKQKNDYYEKFRKKEKQIEDKRLTECKKRASLFQSFSFNKPKSKAEDCLFNIKTEKYLIKEANYFRKEKNKRKILIKSMTKEELDDFSKSYDNYKNEYYKKSEEKQKKLFLDWKKRKEQLPNFMSSFFEIADKESKKNQEMERENKEKIEYLLQNKKDYSEKIKEEKKPKIDEKLKKRRLNDIFKIENPKLANIKDALLKRKKKKIISQSKSISKIKIKSILKNGKNKNKSKPKSSKSYNNKHKNDIITELDRTKIINKHLIHKPIKIKFVNSSSSPENLSNKIFDKKINYLKKIYNNKTYKININENKSVSVDMIKNKKIDNKKKWDDLLKEKNNSLLDNIELVKRKADILDIEADKNEKLLNFNGGIGGNPKLGQKVSNLLLDSIQAKLSILNQINKQIV
jgi:hypothetical protein